MAITSVERTNILKLVVAMFNVPAGSTYLSEIAGVFEANGRNLSALAQTLSTTGAYKQLNPNFQTAQEFAAKFLTPYGLQSSTEAVDFIVSKFNTGANKGQIALDAATAINAYTGTDASIIAAKAIQNNKTSVAEYYSVTKGIPQTDLTQLGLAFGGVTADATSVAAASASIDGATATPGINLTVGFDSLFGTAAGDTFTANVVQNALGQQVNTLGSGDTLNGGGGTDTLSAKIAGGVYAGSTSSAASSPIQAITKSIEIIKLSALNAVIPTAQGDAQPGTNEVYVSGRDMASISKIGSFYSDANLVLQNLTTLNDQGLATRLAGMTIGMEYTGNKDTRWQESDLSAYFDQDYLTRDTIATNASVDLRLMNEDAYDATLNTTNFRPLTSVVIGKLNITLNGVGYSLAQFIVEDRDPNGAGRGNEIETYAQLLTAVQGAIVKLKAANPTVAALQTLQANLGAKFLSDAPSPGAPQRIGDSITISAEGQTNGVVNTLVIKPTDFFLTPAAGISSANPGDIPNSNRFERALPTPANQSTDLLTINVALEKAGLAGDGGELVVGSMFKDSANTWQDRFAGKGIERFNVTVSGGNDKPSSLSGMHSTGNNLKEVIVKTNAAQVGTFAGLTIGNSNTDSNPAFGNAATPLGKVTPGQIAVAGTVFQPSVDNANALKDVRVFNAADLKGDLTLFAAITGESVAKYMTLTDGGPLAATDNVSFQYTGGAGNDYINLFLAKDNLAAAGTTTREDFSLNIDGGAGNDEIVTKIGDGFVNAGENWYANSKINANLTVNGGAGNDTIRTLGAGDFIINGGAGNDTIYAENTGAKAVYVFNVVDAAFGAPAGTVSYNTANLLSQDAASQLAVNANLTVTFKGLTATAVIANSAGSLVNVTITDLSVNQAIKAAINTDAVLSKLLVAEDGPGHSLVVRSLIDGLEATTDLAVTFGSTGALSAGQTAAAVTLFAVAPLVADGYATTFGQNAAGVLQVGGNSSLTQGDHIINGGADNDVIVLSNTVGVNALLSSNDTVVFSTGFGNDTVVNFTVGTTAGADKLDFIALGGDVNAAFSNFSQGLNTGDKSVSIVTTTTANNTSTFVATQFADQATAMTHVYVAVDTATNIGSVYSVVDTVGIAVGSVTATLVGTLDLADTLFSTLTAQNVA